MPDSVLHHSMAWLLTGVASIPGILALHNGRLSFTSENGAVFEAPLARVTDVAFPWYYFSGGFTVTVGGIRRRISLTRPNGAPRPSMSLADALGGDLLASAVTLRDVGAGRAAGKAWRALLTGSATTTSTS